MICRSRLECMNVNIVHSLVGGGALLEHVVHSADMTISDASIRVFSCHWSENFLTRAITGWHSCLFRYLASDLLQYCLFECPSISTWQLCCLWHSDRHVWCVANFDIRSVAQDVYCDYGHLDILVHSLANAPEIDSPLLQTTRKVSLDSYCSRPACVLNVKF